MHYIRIDPDYIDFLRNIEPRIPNQDYGEGHYKPFYILDELACSNGDVLYVTQLTSPKARHFKMKENIDFKKLYNPNSGKLMGATNLNYMFPVLPEYIELLSFNDLKAIVGSHHTVQNLAIQKKVLDQKHQDLRKSMQAIYRIKYADPKCALSKRCLDFKSLEAAMLEFKLQDQFQEKITVERSNDHSTFFVCTGFGTFEYHESLLKDMYGFLCDINDELQKDETLDRSNELSL